MIKMKKVFVLSIKYKRKQKSCLIKLNIINQIDESAAAGKDEKATKLLNQFNFCDRAAQTINNPIRVGSKLSLQLPITNIVINIF